MKGQPRQVSDGAFTGHGLVSRSVHPYPPVLFTEEYGWRRKDKIRVLEMSKYSTKHHSLKFISHQGKF